MQAPVIQPRQYFAMYLIVGPRKRQENGLRLEAMADTLPTTSENAARGTVAAFYVDAPGALGVPGLTSGIDGLAYASILATHREADSAPPPASTSTRPRWPALALRPPTPSPLP